MRRPTSDGAFRAKRSYSENRMVKPFTGKAQTGANILRFKVGMLGQNPFSSQVGGEQVQHIRDANPHPSNTGSSPALLGICRDAIS